MEPLKQEILDTRPCRYGVMSFFKKDDTISRSLVEYGEWAQREIELLDSFVHAGDTVVDIGAFIGTHTLALAQMVGSGRVYAFEPQPMFFEVLKNNIEQNGLTNVTALNEAVSETAGQLEIPQVDPHQFHNFGGTSLVGAEASSNHVPHWTIEVTTVDQLSLDECDLIKIDAENMEINVLRGARHTLRTKRPTVFAECNSLEFGWPLVEFFRGEGYCAHLLNFQAFNPGNFRANTNNVFEDGREASLVFVPDDRGDDIRGRFSADPLSLVIPIRSVDDLALGLLKKPQYKYEVLANAKAASVVGVEFWANETELRRRDRALAHKVAEMAQLEEQCEELRNTLDRRDSALAQLEQEREAALARQAAETARFEVAREELRDTIQQRESALAQKTKDAEELALKLNAIYSSRLWRARSAYKHFRGNGGIRRIWDRRSARRYKQDLEDERLLGESGLFDTDWYLRQYPDVAEAGENAVRHYLLHGAIEGRDPNAIFDTDWYLEQYPDVAEAGENPLKHYLMHGAKEGRAPNPIFNSAKYLKQNLKEAGNLPLAHEREHAYTKEAAPADLLADSARDYENLTLQISAIQKSRIERLHPKSPSLISLREDELFAYAKSLMFPETKDIGVSIIIPVFGQLKFVLECLTSIVKHSDGIAYEVIVVDDGSLDGTPEVLSEIPNLRYVRNETNLGFVQTCNRGGKMARGEYVLFLNSDTQVTPSWLKPLVDTFREEANVGAVGPKLIYPNGRLQEAGAFVNRDGTTTMIGLSDDPELPRYNYAREVTYCSGACLLVKADLFNEIGGFDTAFAPAYCEDCELSFRLRARGLRVFYNPKSVIVHHLSVTSDSVGSSFKMYSVTRNRQKLAEKWQNEIDQLNEVRLIALYLPQYHPIPENDRWWGKGFTEWTNVTKARPNFAGHYQPHLPADLGFYDLRVEDVMAQQAALAKRYGVSGFCYYYYWFGGKRLLQLPLEKMLQTGKPQFPFCIAWANENWTRRWDGREHEVLIGQQHSDDDDRAVILDMMRYLRHPEYISIEGKPLLIVYRANLLPDIKRTTAVWREVCRREGIGDIYLALMESFEYARTGKDPREAGFDASIEFPAHGMSAPIDSPGTVLNANYTGVIHDYRQLIINYLQASVPSFTRFRGVMPSWDNTARRQNDSVMFGNSTPGAYQVWLEAIIEQTKEQNFGDERIVFINAWNEWAEGNHLEPDRRYGHAYLEATRNAQQQWLLQTNR